MSVDISRKLLGWYDAQALALPWRDGRSDPYRVWLSEIMLQQTTVAAVKPYFARFIARWPTVEALAAADDGDVMAAWAGLGYYARARNLLACARHVTTHGYPDDEAGLRQLPGVGAYTAAAIAAIAFGRRAVVVDGNVERVVARLFAVATPLPAARRALHAHADGITPDFRAGDFAQAMMDLGRTICTPRAPKCLACPLHAECAAFASGDPARFPVRAAKTVKPDRRGTAWWIERNGAVQLIRRAPTGLLAGMRALPSDFDASGSDAPLATIVHVFTHFRLTLDVRRGCKPQPVGEWWPLDRLDEAGLPTVFMKAAKAVLERRSDVRRAA